MSQTKENVDARIADLRGLFLEKTPNNQRLVGKRIPIIELVEGRELNRDKLRTNLARGVLGSEPRRRFYVQYEYLKALGFYPSTISDITQELIKAYKP